jgi:hypothetical protein
VSQEIRENYRTPLVLTLAENPVEIHELIDKMELEGSVYDLR